MSRKASTVRLGVLQLGRRLAFGRTKWGGEIKKSVVEKIKSLVYEPAKDDRLARWAPSWEPFCLLMFFLVFLCRIVGERRV